MRSHFFDCRYSPLYPAEVQYLKRAIAGKTGPGSYLIRVGWMAGLGVVLSSAPLPSDSSQLPRINHPFLFHRKKRWFF